MILLLDILREDALFCRIYIENTGKWIDGVLTYLNLDKHVADIFVSSRHFRSLVAEGTKIIVKSLDSNEEYIFTGMISTKIVSIKQQSLTIRIDEVVKFDNDRLHERFHCNYPAILIHPKSPATTSGILSDISSGGIQISSPTLFEPNTSMSIEVFFATERPIHFVGRVLRKTATKVGYNYGVIIEEIDNENAIQLNKLIESLVTEKKGIFEELKVFKRLKTAVYIILFLIACVFLTLFFLS